jgi:hypothetical protein
VALQPSPVNGTFIVTANGVQVLAHRCTRIVCSIAVFA